VATQLARGFMGYRRHNQLQYKNITYHLQTLGFVQKFKINSLDNEKSLVVAFDVELRVGFYPDGVNN